jgi:hypothetical protein
MTCANTSQKTLLLLMSLVLLGWPSRSFARLHTDAQGNTVLGSARALRLEAPNISVGAEAALTLERDPTEPLHAVHKRYVDESLAAALVTRLLFDTPLSKVVVATNASNTASIDCGEDYVARRCSIGNTDYGSVTETAMRDQLLAELQNTEHLRNTLIELRTCTGEELGTRAFSVAYSPSELVTGIAVECHRSFSLVLV